MDQELKTYLDALGTRMDERFSQVDERFNQMQAQMDQRFTGLEAEVRHTQVLVEGLDSNIRLIAEAVVGTNERIDRMQAETSSKLNEIKSTVHDIQRSLVPRVEVLESRVEILESRVDRANRDILEVVREKFGPRQAQ